MLRIERSADGEDVCFTISGRIEAAHVAELQRLIDEETAGRSVVLDLRDVKLVDRDAVTFLVRCEAIGVRLDNCPAYVREWIGHEVDEPRGREVPPGERPKTRKK
jgi:hypothetical protein